VVDGTPNGAFEPERAITRAEFLKMTLKGFGYTYSENDASAVTFSDVNKDHWTAKVIGKAQILGVISSENENFRPNDSISRAEAMKILLGVASSVDPKFLATEATTSSFVDVTTDWQKKYIEKAKALGIISGQKDSNGDMIFRPDESITRAETSKVVVKATKQ